jgi:hypothetical protein
MLEEEGMYGTCATCGWEDDGYQRRYPDDNGANMLSLNQAKEMLSRGESIYDGFPKK